MRPRLPEPILAAVVVTLLVACGGETPGPKTAPDAALGNTTGADGSDAPRPDHPVLAFDRTVIDFGRMGDWEQRQAVVTFRNAGDGMLEVSKVEPTCGCTSVGFNPRLTYGADETGTIVLDFTPKGQGQQRKDVRVVSNDPDEPVRTVTITAQVIPALSASPRVLQLGRIPYRSRHATGTTLTALEPGVELDTITTSGGLAPHLSTSIRPTAPDDEGRPTWRVDVLIDDRVPWGWFTGTMVVSGRIRNDEGVKPVKMNFAFNGSAEGEIAASDSMFRFMMVDGGERGNRTVDLRRVDLEPFRVLGAVVAGSGSEGLVATPAPLDPDGRNWRVDLEGRMPSTPGVFKGEVVVQTDVPGEEVVILRYSGVVRR